MMKMNLTEGMDFVFRRSCIQPLYFAVAFNKVVQTVRLETWQMVL